MTEESKARKKKPLQPEPVQPTNQPQPNWQYRAVFRLPDPNSDPVVGIVKHRQAILLLTDYKYQQKLLRQHKKKEIYNYYG